MLASLTVVVYKLNFSSQSGEDIGGNQASVLTEEEARSIAENIVLKTEKLWLLVPIMRQLKLGGLTPLLTRLAKDVIRLVWWTSGQKQQKLIGAVPDSCRRQAASRWGGFLPVRAEILAQKRFALRSVIATNQDIK